MAKSQYYQNITPIMDIPIGSVWIRLGNKMILQGEEDGRETMFIPTLFKPIT